MKQFCLITFAFSIILYIIGLFVFPFSSSTSSQEIEFIIILVIPCLLLLFHSFRYNDYKSKRLFLFLYLIAYFVALAGFVFSSYRSNYATFERIIVRDVNMIPFSSIIELLTSKYGLKFALYNIFGNLLMLTPFAVIISLLSNKSKKIFSITTLALLISFAIELIQYITNSGSFDIDDIILNVSGVIIALLITKISFIKNIINYLLLKFHSDKKIFKIINAILFIFNILLLIIFSINLVSNYNDFKVDLSHLQCETNEKTYITSIGNYRYYSECNYGNSNIYVGKIPKSVERFINSKQYNEKYDEKLKISKEKIISNVEIEYSKNNNKELVYSNINEKQDYYLVNIDSINFFADNKKYSLLELLSLKNSDINPLSLTIVTKYNESKDVTFAEGDYFNVIICHNNSYSKNYIVPREYNLNYDICK